MKKSLMIFIVAVLCIGQVFGQQGMAKMTYYGHLYLESSINGKPARMIFDTGSPYTCLDSIFVAESGLEFDSIEWVTASGAGDGVVEVPVVLNKLSYTFGEREFINEMTPVMQIKPIVGDFADGIIGMSHLSDKVISIDYVADQMRISDSLGDTAGYTAIPIRYENNHIYVPITLGIADSRWMSGDVMLDLGSGNSVSIPGWEEVREISPRICYTDINAGVGGGSSGCFFRAKSVTVGPFTFDSVTMDYRNNTVGALSTGSDCLGIAGNAIWERFDMIIDMPGRMLYLKKNAHYGTPVGSPLTGFFPSNRSITLGCWIVNGICTGSNAEKVGLRCGDHIIAVNGRSVREIGFDEMRTFFDGMKSITLTVQRDDGTEEISFDFDKPKI